MKLRNMPELRTVRHFHDDAGYIDALAQGGSPLASAWPAGKTADELSRRAALYPGQRGPLPLRMPENRATTGRKAGLESGAICGEFPKPFWPGEWMQPYTSATLEKLGKEGCKRLDVICRDLSRTVWKRWKK
jgi:ferrochelatase